MFLAICAGVMRSKRADLKTFWDAHVYATAFHQDLARADPYAAGADNTDFVYPPLFLKIGTSLARNIPGRSGWFVYIAVMFLAIGAIPWALRKVFLPGEWMTALLTCVLFALQPKLYAEVAFLSGNIATPLYAVTLIAAIPGVRRNQWTLFYLAVAISALIKVPFLSLLLLSWFVGTNQFLKSVLTATFVLLGYTAEWAADRALFAKYLGSVHRQVLEGGDTGIGVLAMFSKLGTRVAAMQSRGMVLGSVAAIVLLLALLSVLRRYRELPGIAELWVPTVLIAAIVSNPRMMAYEADVAFVPAIFLFVEWARRLAPSAYRWVWISILPGLFLLVVCIGPATAIFLLIIGSLLLVLSQMLAVARQARRSGAPLEIVEEAQTFV